MAITLTERAVAEVKKTLDRRGLSPDETFLRVGVRGGGCSGFGYTMEFTSQKEASDREFDCDGVKVICDPAGFIYLDGAHVDFRDGLSGQGFAFKNPNAKGACGCGSSFSV